MKQLTAVFAAAFAFIGLSAANASTLSFNWTPNPSNFATKTVTVDGVDVTYSAANFIKGAGNTATVNMGGNSGQAVLSQHKNYGLALKNSPADDKHLIDGSGWNDLVVFEFSEKVSLDLARFNYVKDGDQFALFVGDALSDLTSYTVHNIAGGKNKRSVGLNVMGKVFAIGTPGKYDDFKLWKLNFTEIPTDPVPLPAGLPLLATGLAAFGFARKRKKA